MPRSIRCCLPWRSLSSCAHGQDSLDKLCAPDFWTLVAPNQPFNTDEHPAHRTFPAGLAVHGRPPPVPHQKTELAASSRWTKFDPTTMSPPSEPISSHRVPPSPRSLGTRPANRVPPGGNADPTSIWSRRYPLTELLLPPPPFDEARSRELIALLENIASILDEAKAISSSLPPRLRISRFNCLVNIRAGLGNRSREIAPLVPLGHRGNNSPDIEAATRRSSLIAHGSSSVSPPWRVRPRSPHAYLYFFQHVALYPFTRKELLAASRRSGRARLRRANREASQSSRPLSGSSLTSMRNSPARATAKPRSALLADRESSPSLLVSRTTRSAAPGLPCRARRFR